MSELKVTEVPFNAANWQMLAPPPGCCQECAVKHEPDQPHNRDSLHYQYAFRLKHERWPTWKDALAHCPEHIRTAWAICLRERGVEIETE